MDNQDPRKISSIPGQESHGGVHLCHKCGWPFPNPHPSAKQRRSHKKICGTIEGYKSIESDENPHLAVSDDEHPSDDDFKTPSPKLLKKMNSGVGSGSSGEISNRSEYEVFSDAVAEFSDARPTPEIGDHLVDARQSVSNTEKVAEVEPITTLLDKESAVTESAAVLEDVTACPSRLNETKGDVKGDGKDLDGNLLVSPSESARETSEEGCKLEEMNGNSSDMLIADAIVILKEEKSGLSHTMPPSDISPEVESDVNIDTLGDAAQIQVYTDRALDFGSADTIEGSDTKGEGSNSEHFILFPDSIPVVNHPEIMVEGFKDPKAFKYNKPITLGSYEASRDEEDDGKDLVSEVHSNSDSKQLTENVGASFPGVHALNGGSSELMVEGVPIEGEPDIRDIKDNTDEKLLSDQLGSPADKSRTEIEKCETVSPLEEQESQDSCDGSSKKILPEHCPTLLSDTNLLVSLMKVDDNQTVNVVRGDDADNHEKAMKETNPGSGNDPLDSQNNIITGLMKGDDAGDHDKVDNIISGVTGSQVAENGGMNDSVICTDTESTHLYQVSDSSRVGIDVSHLVETHSNLKICQDEESQESTEQPEINSNKNVELLQKTSENQLLLPVESASVRSSVIVEDEHTRVLGGCVSGIVSESLLEEGDRSFSKQQPGVSAVDVSVDSLSQTDSLEGNWGSVSDATVLSTLSDALAVVDAEAVPSTDSQVSTVAKKANTGEGHRSDKPDIFEPPSFMTLVEPGGGDDLKINDSEIQTVQNSQQSNSAPSQAGWFPSLTNVVNDSQGRKKNEEIIAKVTNWSAGKQHTPLKSLLGEANAETKQKTSNPKENPTPMVQKDGTATNSDGNLVTTVNSILGPDPPVAQAAKAGTGQEWNSPARYPSEIKRERRKAKGKPYWVPFVCCSSVN